MTQGSWKDMLAMAEPIRRSDSKVAVEERQDTRGVEDESDQDLEREAKEIQRRSI